MRQRTIERASKVTPGDLNHCCRNQGSHPPDEIERRPEEGMAKGSISRRPKSAGRPTGRLEDALGQVCLVQPAQDRRGLLGMFSGLAEPALSAAQAQGVPM